MARISPAVFLQQVKQEVAKITWPTRQEALQMTIFVIVCAAFLSMAFLFIDKGAQSLIAWILGV